MLMRRMLLLGSIGSGLTTSEERLRLLTSLIAPCRYTSMNLSLAQTEAKCVSVRYRVPLARDLDKLSRSAAIRPIMSFWLVNVQLSAGVPASEAVRTSPSAAHTLRLVLQSKAEVIARAAKRLM